MISWFRKRKKEEQVVESPSNPLNRGWKDFTPEELLLIAKMMDRAAYGDVVLNFNDVFAYASAWGVDVDEFDLLSVSELFSKYGIDGVIAWGAVKEEVEKPIGGRSRFPRFKEAKQEIESNKAKYFWMIRYKQNKEGSSL